MCCNFEHSNPSIEDRRDTRLVSWHPGGVKFFIPNPCRQGKSRHWPDQRQRSECRLWTSWRGRCTHRPRSERLAHSHCVTLPEPVPPSDRRGTKARPTRSLQLRRPELSPRTTCTCRTATPVRRWFPATTAPLAPCVPLPSG